MADRTPQPAGSTPSLTGARTTFDPTKLLPKDIPQFVQKAVRESVDSSAHTESARTSDHEVLVDQLKHLDADGSPTDEAQFVLQIPQSTTSRTDAAIISKKLFSVQHLHLIISDRTFHARFAAFLKKYKPEYAPVLSRYQATQKAKAAVAYANALAQGLPYLSRESLDGADTPAVSFHDAFQNRATSAEIILLDHALPAYLTHRLVLSVTESLVKEITGQNLPFMQDMVKDIGEVYCISDPSQPDNPIAFASENFYQTTQYGIDLVIGRNCRFLNGPDTKSASRKRVGDAIRAGQEICETILNYRRDGTPFLNLLMVSPLYDNKGRVRYFIGAQIDITNLVDQGRSIDSFQRLLAKEHAEKRFGDLVKQKSSHALADFGHLLSCEEIDLLKSSMAEGNSESPLPSVRSRHGGRRHIGMDSEEVNLWPLKHLGPSLPGVYQNYLLVRPYPSLRITFTSPSLRIPGMAQSRLMSRIGGPGHVRDAILEAFQEGTSVTAKVSWLASPVDDSSEPSNTKYRWIHCTPLLGADNRVGVYMVVLVEQEEITGSLNVHQRNVQPHRIITSPENSVYRQPSLGDRHPPAQLYAQYLRGIRAQAPERTDSLRSRMIDEAKSFDSNAFGDIIR